MSFWVIIVLYNAIMSTITGATANVIPNMQDLKKMKANQVINKISNADPVYCEDLPFDEDILF